MKEFIQIHPSDNVAVALTPLSAAKIIVPFSDVPLTLIDPIPTGHKFALKPISSGAPVIKYGHSIGHATTDIPAGAWVHTHNLSTGLNEKNNFCYTPDFKSMPAVKPHTFQGYLRSDGSAGIRNDLWIIPTVACVNKVALKIEQLSQKYISERITGVKAFTHPYGCSQLGSDQKNTCRILSGLIRHPNAGGVLVLGLGCENTTIDMLKSYLGSYDSERVHFLSVQDCADEISEAMHLMDALASYANRFTKESIDCSRLIVGLKCGGSDGLSGITANPVVGAFSDMLTSIGGTTILTEVPEMFGAETVLFKQCKNESVFQQAVHLIENFKAYFIRHGQPVSENPSPGNKAGGISTLEDKSLGCIQKAGHSPICGVLDYGEPTSENGLLLLNAPGNDPIATTALAASGAQLILFTTGRGTPFSSPVPTLKLSSNSPLYEKKPHWIDFNCGTLLEDATIKQLAEDLFNLVLRTASGTPAKSETAGYSDAAIWKQGVTL